MSTPVFIVITIAASALWFLAPFIALSISKSVRPRQSAEKPSEQESDAALGAAASSIRHVLSRIRNDPPIGWYLGIGTESFELLTSAYARLTGNPVQAIQADYRPLSPKDPSFNEEALEASCSGLSSDQMDDTDVIDYLAGLSTFTREQLLRDIRRRFCFRCSGDQGDAGLPCQCPVGITRKLRFVA